MKHNLLRRFLRKGRKYPIKRDQFGESARRRAFALFEKGRRPAEVAPQVGISCKTACRYFQDWKKLPRNLEWKYSLARAMLKRKPEFSERIIKDIVDLLGLPLDEVKARLQQPWGTKRLLLGRWGSKQNRQEEKQQSREWARLEAAIMLIHLYEVAGVPLERSGLILPSPRASR